MGKAQRYANEIERYGEDIISGLSTQEEILKKVRTRTIQMLTTIGMSESILKLVEKRSKTDLLIFCGLVLLTVVLIYVLINYVK